MKNLKELITHISTRVNINLRDLDLDVRPYIADLFPLERFAQYSALCGLSPDHALHFRFKDSCLSGSYFLDRCLVKKSVVYKSDIRGDELKRQGDLFKVDDFSYQLDQDEEIQIKDSFLAKTLVHNHSHDANFPELFLIQKTVSMPYANIHGSPVTGSFLSAGSTIDLTSVQDSVIGTFSYIQVGEMAHRLVGPGQIWISAPRSFDFRFKHDPDLLAEYIRQEPGKKPEGFLPEFLQQYERDFEMSFENRGPNQVQEIPPWSAVSPYALLRGDCRLERNVFVAQRSMVVDSVLGRGSNVQENCFIIRSVLSGNDVTAHGGKVIHARLGEKVFVGFNSLLRGREDRPLEIGSGCIIMPHTIIDLAEPLTVPPDTLVWGIIRNAEDLKTQSAALSDFNTINGEFKRGRLIFHGLGRGFVEAFQHRIDHILEENGAFFNGGDDPGHAQRSRKIAFNIIQPFPDGPQGGMFPSIEIRA